MNKRLRVLVHIEQMRINALAAAIIRTIEKRRQTIKDKRAHTHSLTHSLILPLMEETKTIKNKKKIYNVECNMKLQNENRQ